MMGPLDQVANVFPEQLRWMVDILLPVLVGALVPLLLWTVRALLQAYEAGKLTAEARFNAALTSDDLVKLSSYLRDEFGEVSLAIYLRDVSLRTRLDKYLARLSEFVAPPTPDGASIQIMESPKPGDEQQAAQELATSSYWVNEPSDPPQILAALQNARAGESWNALARLRRDLEARFRAELMGIGQGHLPMHKLPVPPDAEYQFRRFYRTASRAIHGEETTEDEVIQAIQDARSVYRTMDLLTPGWSSRPISKLPPKRRAIF